MTVGLLGILVEIRTPGFGFPGAIGLLSFGVLFWGHWIVQRYARLTRACGAPG